MHSVDCVHSRVLILSVNIRQNLFYFLEPSLSYHYAWMPWPLSQPRLFLPRLGYPKGTAFIDGLILIDTVKHSINNLIHWIIF